MRDTGLRFVNFLLHFVVVLCLALACRAQGASNIPNTISIQASGAPSGACGNNFVYTNSATNDFYNCVAGAWNKVSSAGGAGTVTSIATTGPIGGGTITATGTITCTTCTTATTPTNHGVILGAGSQALGVTAAGTTGQVLTGVTGSDPTFQSVTLPTGVGGPGMILVEEHTASASATLDLTACFSSTYDEYVVTATNLVNATNTQDLQALVGTGGTPTYQTSSYELIGFSNSTGNAGFNGAQSASTSAAAITLFPAVDNSLTTGTSVKMYVDDPLNATIFKSLTGTVSSTNGARKFQNVFSAWWDSATAVTALRFKFASGNITSGTVRCYGVTK